MSPSTKKSDFKPWNKGRKVGPKAPLTLAQVRLLSGILKQEGNRRDLALFLISFDSMLRASDLLNLRLGDLTTSQGKIRTRFEIIQKKTGKPVTVALTRPSEEALASCFAIAGKLIMPVLTQRLSFSRDYKVTRKPQSQETTTASYSKNGRPSPGSTRRRWELIQ